MTDSRNDEADRTASATGGTDAGNGENDDMMPGTTGGTQNYLPSDGRAASTGTPATAAPDTIGAVGEMDFTGAPAGTSGAGDTGSGSSAGSPVGGGTGGGSISRDGEK